MPSRILLSGPAGGRKSQAAWYLRSLETEPTILVDFQSLHVALTGDQRNQLGRFPLRDERLLPITEYVRLAAIGAAVDRDLGVIATNSDGSPARRAGLLRRLSAGAREEILDPGEDFVTAALEDPFFEIDPECSGAIGRWYTRI